LTMTNKYIEVNEHVKGQVDSAFKDWN